MIGNECKKENRTSNPCVANTMDGCGLYIVCESTRLYDLFLSSKSDLNGFKKHLLVLLDMCVSFMDTRSKIWYTIVDTKNKLYETLDDIVVVKDLISNSSDEVWFGLSGKPCKTLRLAHNCDIGVAITPFNETNIVTSRCVPRFEFHIDISKERTSSPSVDSITYIISTINSKLPLTSAIVKEYKEPISASKSIIGGLIYSVG